MPDWSPLDALLQAPIDRGALSGAVVKVWHRGAPAHRAALGHADVAAGTPMRADTLFRLYSMTKPVTAAAMMILWDEGRWSPDDALADHLPELAGLAVFAEDGAHRPAARGPTVGEVMTHRAGFAYGLAPEPVDRAFAAAGVPSFPRAIAGDEYLRRLATAPLAFEPGEGWRYSAAMDVQGLLVERLSGQSFADFLRERLFAPLGMADTGFRIDAGDRARLATLYVPAGDGLAPLPVSDFAPDYATAPLMASGGAGLVSTAGDYVRFARMLHGGGALDGVRVLSERAVAEMTRSHTPGWMLERGFGTAPHFLRPGYEYAYNGVVVTDPAAAGVALGRGTYFWDGAAGTWFWTDPANDVVMVCLVQLLADADHLGLQFAARDVVAGIVADERAAA